MAELTPEQFEAAKARGDGLLRGPVAVAAHYDCGRDRVIIRLSTGVELGLSPGDVEGLEKTSAEDLQVIEIEAGGLAIRMPSIDADLYVPTLMAGVLGSRRWMARLLGAAGGDARGEAKTAAARRRGHEGVGSSLPAGEGSASGAPQGKPSRAASRIRR